MSPLVSSIDVDELHRYKYAFLDFEERDVGKLESSTVSRSKEFLVTRERSLKSMSPEEN
jgi:hypothetical protein